MTHELKCWDEFMDDIATETKQFEVRKNDRGFNVGDTLILKGWNNYFAEYTGAVIEAEVTYALTGGVFGIEEGYVVMGIKVIHHNPFSHLNKNSI